MGRWSSAMQSKISIKDHYWIISYEGDMTELLPGPLPEIMQALKKGVHEIVLDLTNLRYLSQLGIKAIRESYTVANEREANIGVVNPQPQVRCALKLSGLFPSLPIYENRAEAISKLDLVDYEKSAVKDLTDRLLIIQKDKPLAGELRDAIKKHSIKQNYRMFPCRDIERAGEILHEERIDCILIDCNFPLYQLTNLIEKVHTDERLQSTPVLIITSNDKLDQAEMLVRNGAQEILRYPFQPVEVVIRLQTMICYLKEHHPRQDNQNLEQTVGWRA
jgi:anti-anti-sigma factor